MKKGFTLIELLAVIVILAIIAVIVVPIILNITNNSKEEANKRSIEMYADALKNSIARYQLSGKELKAGNLKVINKSGGKEFEGTDLKVDYDGNVICETIEIYNDGNIYLSDCKVNDIEVEYTYGKKYICIAADDKTTPNKPPYTGYNSGDAYDCEVKEDTWYRFYILSIDENNVNLIAQQNITPTGEFTSELQDEDEWYVTSSNSYDNRYGPQTAYTYLSTATNNWTNIPIIENFTYEDEGYKTDGYRSIITEFSEETGKYITTITPRSGFGSPVTYENMRARLPKYSEVIENTSCGVSTSIDNYGSCPLWMVNYLRINSCYSTDNGKVNSTGDNNGYWISSSRSGSSYYAHLVSFYGDVASTNTSGSSLGIRPVITVLKSDLLRVM